MRGYYPGEREYRERRAHKATAGAAGAEPSARRRVDWIVGILLGIVLGISIVVAFLLFGSEGTIDAPRIHGVDKQAPQSRPLEPVKE